MLLDRAMIGIITTMAVGNVNPSRTWERMATETTSPLSLIAKLPAECVRLSQLNFFNHKKALAYSCLEVLILKNTNAM